jgi:cytochrome c oxidase cbb3-type subunit 3
MFYARVLPPTIVVGNAGRGAVLFQARCASCHSASADLKGLASRMPDARALQDYWLVPTAGRGRGAGLGSNLTPVTATVTLASGERVEGRLLRLDDFTVTVVPADGVPRAFGRRGDTPAVVVTDPVKPHRDMLPSYADREIHDITAYLVTLK